MIYKERRLSRFTQHFLYLPIVALIAMTLPVSFVNADNPVTQYTVEEVIVLGQLESDDRTEMSSDAKALLSIAGDIGDPLKAILALPSITFGGGDFDAPVIRGGGPSDNLYIVDGIMISNLFHELGEV